MNQEDVRRLLVEILDCDVLDRYRMVNELGLTGKRVNLQGDTHDVVARLEKAFPIFFAYTETVGPALVEFTLESNALEVATLLTGLKQAHELGLELTQKVILKRLSKLLPASEYDKVVKNYENSNWLLGSKSGS